MAISPPSDIVLEVARAADPALRREAADRLGGAAAASAASFEATLAEAGSGAAVSAPAPAAPRLPFDATGALVSLRNRQAIASPALDPYEQFEGFVLQSFVQSMLPSDTGLFGRGTAGEIWRSMLAEGLGKQMASAGGIGIAERLAAASETAGSRGGDLALSSATDEG